MYMSCGMTPEIMEMIAKMQRGEHVPGMSPDAPPPPPAAAPKAKATSAPAASPPAGWDWTRNYGAWDKWEVRGGGAHVHALVGRM